MINAIFPASVKIIGFLRKTTEFNELTKDLSSERIPKVCGVRSKSGESI